MARKAFLVHSDYYGELRGLNMEQRNSLFLALIEWADHDKEPELDQMCAFPNGAHDDQVDAMSQALIRYQKRRVRSYLGQAGAFGEIPDKCPYIIIP